MTTSVSVVLYTSKTLSNGEHPLMLRLTKERKLKYISLHLSLDAKFWDFAKNRPKRNCPDKDRINALIDLKIKEYQQQVLEFKTNDKDYTLSTLIHKASNQTVKRTVGEYLDLYTEQLISENRLGNARTFKELKASLLKFGNSLDFYFIDLDIEWLRRYENWLRSERKMAENSIGIRFRSLRVLYNRAIVDNLVKKSAYPFDEYKVSHLKEPTVKRAISKDDIKRLVNFDVKTMRDKAYPTPYLELAKDLFLFSYFCCGINLTDILHLKHRNIIDGRLVFKRQKTGKLISFNLQPFGWDIIRKYAQSNSCAEDYIFPVLDDTMQISPKQQYEKIKKANKRINRYLKMIGEYLHFPIPLTTYVARHSFATVLKRSGVSTSIICESLGHSSEKVTQYYLDSFENSQIDEAMKNLL